MLTMGSESPQAIARLFAWVNGISKCELIELKDLSLNDRTELAPEPPAAPPPAAPLTPRQNRDGSYTGFIRVLFKLTRPVSLPPPWKASSPQESGQLDGGMKCRTSFYLPKDTAKHLHIGSRTQIRASYCLLLD
ncbi:uncharacterized protein LOC112254921 isoform X2 [Oncorhynchus tshawytscha]|uniref:uncharacterized protein LOC112254921 isoform X2 n=1 Tax=Oncorhynchus tshawytscha TaxID=74940 RepID=UPI000D099D69|nr:uncharacterized protein LOC112254921 isoform X2 [Oncorhynchus tshawytscha]